MGGGVVVAAAVVVVVAAVMAVTLRYRGRGPGLRYYCFAVMAAGKQQWSAVKWKARRAWGDRSRISLEELLREEETLRARGEPEKRIPFQTETDGSVTSDGSSLRSASLPWSRLTPTGVKALERQSSSELLQLMLLCSFHGLENCMQVISCQLEKAVVKEMVGREQANACSELSEDSDSSEGQFVLIEKKTSRAQAFLERALTTALQLAVRNGHQKVVHVILDKPFVNVDAQNSLGNTSLHLATQSGNVIIVQSLSKRVNDPNVRNRFGVTPLRTACEKGFESIVQVLLDRSDIDPSVNNFEAVRLAASNNHNRILFTLLERSNRAILPHPGPFWSPNLEHSLQEQAIKAAKLCKSILCSAYLEPLPIFIRAYIISLALGNSLVLIGPARTRHDVMGCSTGIMLHFSSLAL